MIPTALDKALDVHDEENMLRSTIIEPPVSTHRTSQEGLLGEPAAVSKWLTQDEHEREGQKAHDLPWML
jgi:hypothetical protein